MHSAKADVILSYLMLLRAYRAPEALFYLQYGTAFDMWSAGCILAELFKGKALFYNPQTSLALRRRIAETLGVSFNAKGGVEQDRSVPIENLLPDALFKFNDEVIWHQLAHLSFPGPIAFLTQNTCKA